MRSSKKGQLVHHFHKILEVFSKPRFSRFAAFVPAERDDAAKSPQNSLQRGFEMASKHFCAFFGKPFCTTKGTKFTKPYTGFNLSI